MIRSVSHFIVLFFLFCLVSCEKDITIKLDPSSTDLVVDASIENGKYPVVVLSHSLAYFNKLDAETLTKSFVHNARVLISNGTTTGQLQEFSQKDDSTGIQLY